MRLFWRKRKVHVHMLDDRPTVSGIWVRNEPGHYVVANAEVDADGSRSFAVEGEMWIRSDRVLYVQVVG